MKPTLSTLLSFNGGYVDTAGYLVFQGLFTAHVTGNFVTLAAALIHGTSGVIAKLLALPVFCAVILITRLVSFNLPQRGLPVLATMLTLKLVLLSVGAALAIWHGPFADGDSYYAIATGLILVAAMAIQNAVHRIHMPSMPPTTLMTGTTTQIMIDLADMVHGLPAGETATRARLGRMAVAVVSFAAGATAAALLLAKVGSWCFLLPPLIALWTRLTAGTVSMVAGGASPPPAPAQVR
jgi:uncharacterized membrane protein YoaK (UPF0700 family)